MFSVYSEGKQRHVFSFSVRQAESTLAPIWITQRSWNKKPSLLCIELNIENSFKGGLSPSLRNNIE